MCGFLTKIDATSNTDSIAYEYNTQAGGKEVKTKNSYFAACTIWVKTTIYKQFANGAPRINPDGTYYPFDAFSYTFSYGYEGNKGCRNFKVCPVKFDSYICDFSKIQPHKTRQTSGQVEIQNQDVHIQLSVFAERYFCIYPKKSKIFCGWMPIIATGAYDARIITPQILLLITPQHLKDKDGFISANLDGTYYLWDAVNFVHRPQYVWKQERVNTISVVISKKYDLNLEDQFQCESKFCTHTLRQNGFEPWTDTYEYGTGYTLLNATQPAQIKKQTITYKIQMFNLGKLIHTAENKTSFLVVRYDPKFTNYPYLVLKDGNSFSWANRHAVALNYMGSLGGGQDDTPQLHQNRRSKINSYDYIGYAFDPIRKIILPHTQSWSKSEPISISDGCTNKTNSKSLLAGVNSAIFIKAGYGKIIFHYPILHTMLSKRYINATIQNTLQSENFAGYTTKNLTTYTYQYPDQKFNNPIKILTYNSKGQRTSLPLYVELIPDFTRGANYTHDYVCRKVTRDTGDAGFADIVVSDMYEKQNQKNGTGYLNLKSNLTSTWFAEFYRILGPDMMKLDINTGYGAPSPYQIEITAGQKSRTIHKILNFISPFTHVVNLDGDNRLNFTLNSGYLKINPDEKFGEIVKISVNGKNLHKDCTNGCTMSVLQEGNLYVEAWNLWGGRAFAHINNHTPSSKTAQINPEILGTIVFVLIFGFITYKLVQTKLQSYV